jgi:hypothetical protein
MEEERGRMERDRKENEDAEEKKKVEDVKK